MPSTINADNGVVSGSSGVKTTADTSGVLALQSNGSTGLTLDTSLNVGIGTSSPSTPLHIFSSAQEQLRLGRSSTASSAYLTFYANNSSSAQVQYAGILGDVIASTAGSQSGALIFFTTNTGTSAERMRLDSSGNLGIGTSSPSQKLDATVSSSTEGSGLAVTNSLTGGYGSGATFYSLRSDTSAKVAAGAVGMEGASSWNSNATTSSSMVFKTINANTLAERFRIGPSGQFGIGGATYGTAGQVLTSQGSGAAPIWGAAGSGSPAGSTGQFQYNNAGAFAAAPAMMTTNGTNVRFNPTSTNKLQFFDVNNSTDSIQFFTALSGPYYYSLENHASSPYMGLVWGNTTFVPAGWTNLMSFMGMNVGIGTKSPSATLQIVGSLAKSSGSFRIDHPLPSMTETHDLVHSFVEAPNADLIYSGMVTLVNGSASINIDEASRMTEGTFVLLCRNVRRFCSNESGWTPIKSSITGNILTVEAQDPTCSDEVFWQVIGERQDKHMIDTGWTDEEGRVIVEPLKIQPLPEDPKP